ncbi:rhamnogalacturonan acetylesterase [Victivallis vadensis]|uniref:rhamnogalacturonan acetylesterase n=1 Tax=Victivallis vadensis TaxID=172901 RepID=UPI00266C7177|nr:rhamnogalacturonan acetylesterase [Victivallis vadensis]
MKLNWLFSLAMLSGCLTAAELKVRNLDFSEGEKHWRNAYPDVVQTGLEDGKLKMTVLKEKGSHGAFVQYFAAAPHTKLVFSADVESDQPGIAYLNVKLNKDKQEFASLNSPTAPGGRQRLELFFDTGDADAMAVLCRVQPMAGAVGKNVVFSNLALKPDTTRKIFIAGDSTVENWNRAGDRAGWGQMLQKFCPPDVRVINLAVGGRSTRSFVDEKRWEKLLAQLSPGDLVLIQFGHNDQKKDSPERYAPADGSYREYLKRFIADVRERRGEVVLCTPVARRIFDGAKVRNTLGGYPEAVRKVGAETGTPVIDLYNATIAALEKYGPEKSAELFYVTPEQQPDRTHFNRAGAELVAGEVARALKEKQLPAPRE